jgi:lipopolysaccharide export system permease protein
MRLSPILSIYIGRQFLIGIGIVILVLVSLILLADLIELMRRASGKDGADFGTVAQMALLQLPSLVEKVLPFAALFGGMLTLNRLTRSHELVVTRAAGVSVWQFLMPGLIIALLIGIVTVTVFNPVAAVMVSKFEQLEAKYLRGHTSMLAVSDSGLWLRQADVTGQSVIHALRVSQQGLELDDVIIFLYQGNDTFVGRIDAATARLRDGYWELSDALLTGPDRAAEHRDRYRLRTSLTLDQIQESFASPETLSFWALPGFIDTLEKAGFSAVRHRLYWHTVLSTPLLLCAMVLIAATFSLRLTRRGGTGLLAAAGVLAGFVLYFLSDVVRAFGLSGGIPPIMAAWIPAGVCALLGLGTLFHLEDG